MNIYPIANTAINVINVNVEATLLISDGYTIGEGRKQIPVYKSPIVGQVQIQALDGKDLKQLDGVNMNGTIRALYLLGNLAGVVKPEGKGGDLVKLNNQSWLVVKVLECWPQWSKVAIVLQEDS